MAGCASDHGTLERNEGILTSDFVRRAFSGKIYARRRSRKFQGRELCLDKQILVERKRERESIAGIVSKTSRVVSSMEREERRVI